MMIPVAIKQWHEVVKARNVAGLDLLLADAVVFHSPVVHSPQQGKALTTGYLRAALQVLNNDSFRYSSEWYGTRSAVLEFSTELNGIHINGVDIIEWNDANQIVRFKVMVRPLKAINLLHQMMAAALQANPQAPSAQ